MMMFCSTKRCLEENLDNHDVLHHLILHLRQKNTRRRGDNRHFHQLFRHLRGGENSARKLGWARDLGRFGHLLRVFRQGLFHEPLQDSDLRTTHHLRHMNTEDRHHRPNAIETVRPRPTAIRARSPRPHCSSGSEECRSWPLPWQFFFSVELWWFAFAKAMATLIRAYRK